VKVSLPGGAAMGFFTGETSSLPALISTCDPGETMTGVRGKNVQKAALQQEFGRIEGVLCHQKEQVEQLEELQDCQWLHELSDKKAKLVLHLFLYQRPLKLSCNGCRTSQARCGLDCNNSNSN
jgi:hypothetical protein